MALKIVPTLFIFSTAETKRSLNIAEMLITGVRIKIRNEPAHSLL